MQFNSLLDLFNYSVYLVLIYIYMHLKKTFLECIGKY